MSGAAQAQQIIDISRDLASQAQAVQESVNQQPREEYQPIGIRLGQLLGVNEGPFSPRSTSAGALSELRPGAAPKDSEAGLRDSPLDSFLLHPSLQAELVLDDNLFRVEQSEQSDRVFLLRPKLTLDSDWLNHAMKAEIGGEFGRHQDFASEDYNDFYLLAGPRIDVDENTVLNLELGYSATHTGRGTTDDQLEGPEPSNDSTFTLHADWKYQSDKYSTSMLYDYALSDSEDNGQIERDFLDNSSHAWVFRQGYEFTEGTTAWLQPGLESIDYRQSRDDNGLVRDNQGWTLLAGVTVDRSAVSFLELGLGVMSRDFEDPAQDSFLGLVYQGRMLWNITPLITMDVNLGRTARVVQSTVSPIAVDDGIALKLAWDPREFLIFEATAGFTSSDYQTQPGQELDEDLVEFGLNVQYLMNQNFYIEAHYDYKRLTSSQAGADYTSNLFGLRAGVEL